MITLIRNVGGTAGCCVAGRLAENPKVSVLVIEAGIAYDCLDLSRRMLAYIE